MVLACISRFSSTSFLSLRSSAFHSDFLRASALAYADSIASTCLRRSSRSFSSQRRISAFMLLSRPSISLLRASSISAMRCASASHAISIACSSSVRFCRDLTVFWRASSASSSARRRSRSPAA